DLIISIPDIKRIIEGFNLPCIECDGYEADDIIGALAKQAEKDGYKVFMVTPDKDFGQLVSENIKIYKPGYQGGKVEIMGEKEVCEKWGIQNVKQVVDILGLMGDASDNIPGIAGIGEKTAAKLLAQYGTLENVLADAENIKGSLGEKIRAGKEMAILSKKLATIITDVPCKFHEEDFKVKAYDVELLKEIFTELEFKTLGKRILGEEYNVFVMEKTVVQADLFSNVDTMPVITKTVEIAEEEKPGLIAEKNLQNTTHQYFLIEGEKAIEELLQKLTAEKEISFDLITTNIDPNEAGLLGLTFAFKATEGYYVPVPSGEDSIKRFLENFSSVFNDETKTWIGENIKFNLLVLKRYDIDLRGNLFDTTLAHYVIESESRRNKNLLSAQYLGYLPLTIEELIGKKVKTYDEIREVEIEKLKEYAVESADVTFQLKHVFTPLLKTKQVQKVFEEVETPLLKVLAEMEFQGVNVDTDFLKLYSKELEKQASISEESVFEQAGTRFNLASPKQLGEVLFVKMQLGDKVKKTKGGQYATGEDVLLKLAKENPIVENILNFRELTKLRSTYVDALPQLINKRTGRVHTSYAQSIAVT